MFLFKVEDIFEITGKGLILTPGIGKNAGKVSTGNRIKLIRPDKSEIETIITGIVFEENFAISIEKEINKHDVPLGTEVWLVNKKSN